MGAGDPFDLVGDDDNVGVVCIHGFTGSPYEVRYLGAALARAGMTARGLLLPGHGTSVDELDRVRWEDWVAAVEREVDAMFRRCRRVAVVGQSLGGLLALHVAAHRRDLAAVGSLAAPLWFDGILGIASRWLTGPRGARVRARFPQIPKLGGSDVRDRRARAENPSYRAVSIRALGELLAFMRVVDAELPLINPTGGVAPRPAGRAVGVPTPRDLASPITTPLLVMHGQRDHTAPVACAARIAEQARARRVRILPRSFHLIAIDVERDLVAAEVTAFVRHHAAHPPGASPCVT